MKRTILTALILTIVCTTSSATGQINDKVRINGETWEIPVSPLLSLEGDAYEMFHELLGERTMVSTANYRGYVATWHAGKRGLYLDKVEVMQNNGEMKDIDMTLLKKALKKYRDKGMIRAEWLSGEVNIGRGSGPRDPGNPYAPGFEENWTLILKKGRIKNL